MAGWIKLHRSILDWGWYSEPVTKSVFLDIVLNANYKEDTFRGVVRNCGQLTTSLGAIAERCGVSISQVRTSIEKLKKSHEIETSNLKKCLLITITKWVEYQDDTENIALNSHSIDTQIAQTSHSIRNYQEVKKERSKEVKKRDNTARASCYENFANLNEHPADQKNDALVCSLLDFFNLTTGKNFSKSTWNKSLVEKLLANGFTEDQIKLVVEDRTDRWRDDPKMSEHLAPKTIFAIDKFEAYLNKNAKTSLDVWANETAEKISRGEYFN